MRYETMLSSVARSFGADPIHVAWFTMGFAACLFIVSVLMALNNGPRK